MVAGREGVNVEALADPRLAQARREPRLGRFEILHGGHLDVGGVAFEHISGRARPFSDRDVVGKVADACGGGAPMRFENQREAEGLRRLHGSQRRSRRRREDSAVDIDLLDRVAHWRSGRRRPMPLGGLDRPRDKRGGGEGPHPVVDQHDIRLRSRENLEPGQNTLLARRPSDRRLPKRRGSVCFQMRQRLIVESAILGRMTTVTAEKGKPAVSASNVWTRSGRPAQLRYCFGRSAPSLTPRPPATTRSPILFDDN